MKTIAKYILLGIVSILTIVFLGGSYCSIRCYLHKQKLIKMIENADRVDGYEWDTPNLRVSYVGEELQQIVKAIKKSVQDDTLYDTIVGVIQLEFYQKNIKLIQIGTSGDLFRFEGKQYRTRNRVLVELIDFRLYELRNSLTSTQTEQYR